MLRGAPMIRTIKQVAKYVYNTLGAGHEEAIYRDAMSVELQDRGYTVKTEAPVSIKYKTKKGKEMIVGSGKIDLYATKGKDYAVIELKTELLPEPPVFPCEPLPPSPTVIEYC